MPFSCMASIASAAARGFGGGATGVVAAAAASGVEDAPFPHAARAAVPTAVNEAVRRKFRRDVTPFASAPISVSLISDDMDVGGVEGLVTPPISAAHTPPTAGEINAIRAAQPDGCVGRSPYTQSPEGRRT